MDLRHLRYFVTLAKTLHFAQAAKELNIVQPALSMQIKALEEELGAQLFERTKRKVSLTQTGELFLVEAGRTLAQAQRALDVVEAARRGAIGQVRVGFSAGAVYSGVLADLLRHIRQARPGLELALDECHPNQVFDLLREDKIDVAFSTLFSIMPSPDVNCRTIVTYPPRIVMPSDHPLAKQAGVRPEDLKGEPFIGYTGPNDLDGLGLTQQVLGFMPGSATKVSTPAMAAGMVATGLGLAVVPASLESPASGVVFKQVLGTEHEIDISTISRLDENNGAVLGFLKSMNDRLNDPDCPFSRSPGPSVR